MVKLPEREGTSEEFKIEWMALLEWLFLFSGIGLITIAETYQAYVLVGLAIVGVAFIIRSVRCAHLVSRTGLEIPWILFIGSAGMATFISFQPQLAFLQFVRILAAAALFYAVCDAPSYIRSRLSIGFVVAVTFLAVYWPLQHNFSLEPAKFQSINQFGLWMNAHLPKLDLSDLTGPTIHPNVAAGTLLLGVPFAFHLVWQNLHERRLLGSLISEIALFLILGGLMMTTSRGAWLALATTVALTSIAWIQTRWFVESRTKIAFWSVAGVVVVTVVATLLLTGRLTQLLGQIPDVNGSLHSRPQLWSQGLSLVRDYNFTGSGLMTTLMVYSVYALLVDYPFIAHIHNAFLEVWFEQGILGIIALVWASLLILRWVWDALGKQQGNSWGWVGVAGLVTVAIQGIFDVVFYVERTLPLMGFVGAYAWLLHSPNNRTSNKSFVSLNKWLIAVGVVAILVGGIFFHRQVISSWHANVGAFTQSYLELSHFNAMAKDGPRLDQVRQSLDLSTAEDAFHKALDWNKKNGTARQRLAGIAMSRGEYSTALELMEAAWDQGHDDRVTLMLYGDALVAMGQPEQAAAVLLYLPEAINRLLGQAGYRYLSADDYQRAADAYTTVLILEPDNTTAAQGLERTKKALAP